MSTHFVLSRRQRLLGTCIGVLVAVAGCGSGAADPAAGGATTAVSSAPAPAPATSSASPTVTSGTAESYCALVIKVNTELGTMVGKKLIPSTEWSQAQRTAIVQKALGHRDEFLAATPAELRPDIEVELQWYDNIAAAGYDWTAAAAPPGLQRAAVHIVDYQKKHCGIT
jgi:hypothetical protein